MKARTCVCVFLLALVSAGCSRFQTRPVALCGSTQLRGVAVGDFNGDGADDVAAGCRTRGKPLIGHLEVWLSDGEGSLAKKQTVVLGTFARGGEGAGPITAADVDGDGRLDLVVTDTAGTTHGFTPLYGQGDGLFAASHYLKQAAIEAVVVSDVDGDGNPDLLLLLSSFGSDATHYLPGSGERLHERGPLRLVARDTRGYKQADRVDFNGDREMDAVVPEPRAGRLHLFPGGGAAYDMVPGKAVRQIQRVFSGADDDGDGRPDLLVATRRADGGHDTRWLLSRGGARLSRPLHAVPKDANWVRVADFNGDGVSDLLVGQGYKPKLKHHGAAHPLLLVGKAGGGYAKPVRLDLPGTPGSEVLGDFNGDGRTDLLYLRLDKDKPQALVYLSRM